MDEKTIQKIKKLQALAERGVGGEKDTVEKMLQRMMTCAGYIREILCGYKAERQYGGRMRKCRN